MSPSLNRARSVKKKTSRTRPEWTQRVGPHRACRALLYALIWSIFTAWCQDRDLEPVTSEVSVVLSFLQEMLDKQRSSSTIKVYAAAIAAFHTPIAGHSVGREVRKFNFNKAPGEWILHVPVQFHLGTYQALEL